MEPLKKVIIIVAIVIILLIIAILVILNLDTTNNPLLGQDDHGVDNAEASVDIEETITLVQDDNTFYSIEKNLQNYFLYLKVGNNQAIHEMTSLDYIQENSMTQDNIIENLPQVTDDNYEFKMKELYINDSYSHPIYYGYGELLQNNQKEQYYFIIYTDQVTTSVAIEPITEEQYIQLIQSNGQNEEKSIERTQYNQLAQTTVTTEDIVKKYFQDYIYNVVHDQAAAYNSLNEEYKQSKYATLAQYQQFIQGKQDQFISLDVYSIRQREDFSTDEEYTQYLANLQQKSLRQYSVTEYDEYTQYVGIDDYNNYYIFQETAPMQYKVILDTYTIDLPEFTQEYNNSTEEEKVLLNIQKVFEAINQQDYTYVYQKLDETFKANNFATLQEFTNYAQENFFEQNSVSAANPESQGNTYLYEITISDATGENTNTLTKTFVMQLQEGTDFVMSFSV